MAGIIKWHGSYKTMLGYWNERRQLYEEDVDILRGRLIIGRLRPSSPELLSSLIPNPEGLSWIARLVFRALEYYILICFLESWLLLLSFHFRRFHHHWRLDKILRYVSKSSFLLLNTVTFFNATGNGYLQKHPDLIWEHGQPFVTTATIVSQIFGTTNGLTHVLALLTVILSGYGAVRLQGMESIGLACVALNWTAMWIIWINLLADVNANSRAVLAQAKEFTGVLMTSKGRGREAAAMRKEIASLRDLRVETRGLFYYDKRIVMTTLQIIIHKTTNLILTY